MRKNTIHIIDSPYYEHIYGSKEMSQVFDSRRRYQRWLDIESTLAKVQADLGIIPREAAEEINKKAKLELLDEDFIRKQLALTGHSLMPLLKAVQKVCDKGLGEYIHYGPTTQDIQDTSAVLELRDATNIIAKGLIETEKLLLPLAEKYASFPMVGRTHNQHGLPITLGLKFAGWAAEIRRDIERLKDMSKRLFVIMLHGGTGTMAGLGDKSYETVEALAAALKLKMPATGWGSSRDSFAEYQNVLGVICGTVSRISNEIYQLSRTEINELHEPLGTEYVGSSTMAHKRNAEKCAMNVAVCRIVINNASLGMQSMMSEHERDTRAWRIDWHSLAESSVMTARALETLNNIVSGLDINENAIVANLEKLRGLLFSEAVMFYLAEKLGKLTAHEAVHGAAMRAQKEGLHFKEALLQDPKISGHVTADELDHIMEYSRHIGTSVRQVTDVINVAKALSTTDKELSA
ncbi:class-II fumarase/aspartase family protein [Desulfovibrio litoralis]|uniref:Adenylosuccinate lyase n=1 Tax=Desulfovibrio litoralis DSM 11393 TaxID=1121455 RepID=A0A1M7SH45_9BACT|nr:adenylosuccinate lyase family protein [Desulfovibrio litoralis]SHN57672.1 adenylosuccinate lyase [Desulfovibrio litoralis DSM 11393]